MEFKWKEYIQLLEVALKRDAFLSLSLLSFLLANMRTGGIKLDQVSWTMTYKEAA